jgi:AAA domain, putative AbiEii toxin, Type IV TA system/AAA domain
VYIEHIKIENVRGFGPAQVDLSLDRGDGTFAGWTVFAGRNSAGKTTLLRAIALAVVGPRGADRLQDSFVGWIHSGAESASVTVKLVPEVRDQFRKPARNGREESRSGRDLLSQATFRATLDWQSSGSGQEPTLTGGRSKASRGPWWEAARGWFIAGYGPFRRLSGQTVEAQRMMGRSRQAAQLGTLFRDDASLLDSMEWLRDLRLRSADGNRNAWYLLNIAFALLNDGLLPDPSVRVVRYDADGLWVSTKSGAVLPVGDLSDGYRAVIALVLDIVRAVDKTYGGPTVAGGCILDPGVVLIDEVDAHLHVSWQQRIGPWLKSHFPNMQFLVTSHSPFVCQAADANGLIVLPRPGTSEVARVADEALYCKAVNGAVDEALLSDLFGLDHTWSEASEKKRAEMATLEGRILHAKASTVELERYQQLRAEVPSDPADTFDVDRVLRDGASAVR